MAISKGEFWSGRNTTWLSVRESFGQAEHYMAISKGEFWSGGTLHSYQ